MGLTIAAMRHTLAFVRFLAVVLFTLGVSSTSLAGVFVSVAFAPPPIPVFVQPVCPGPGYIWIPGYWAWGAEGYYWVPGYWALAPFIGALWTPGWWGWGNGVYVWHAGYWSRHVGFYGGIDYGFGYLGVGYVGGYWSGGVFHYNTAINHINVTTIHNTYYRQVAQNTNVARVSYHGGPGGITRQPTAAERLADREQHRPETGLQLQHERLAGADSAQRASVNHGTPGVAATSRLSAFHGVGRSAAFNAPPQHASPPQISREATIERGAQQHVGAPHPPTTRPETHAQVAPRAEMRAPFASRPQTHAQVTPRPQKETTSAPRAEMRGGFAPRPEMHAQVAPQHFQHPGGAPHGEPRGGGPHEERQR